MESHLRNLESRADRRERELQTKIEDVKCTAKLEYARLQSIHSQECREKDEQLVRFQGDLEILVRSLRQWQQIAATSNKINNTDNNNNNNNNNSNNSSNSNNNNINRKSNNSNNSNMNNNINYNNRNNDNRKNDNRDNDNHNDNDYNDNSNPDMISNIISGSNKVSVNRNFHNTLRKNLNEEENRNSLLKSYEEYLY